MTKLLLYAVQWMVFHIGVILSVPVVLGAALGMDQAGTAYLMQMTFLITGLGSLVQVLLGHGGLLVEGPAVPWWGAYIAIAGVSLSMGRSLELVRTDIAGAMLVAGAVMAVLGIFGAIRRFSGLFPPRVTGVLLLLLGIQISGVGVRGVVEQGGVSFAIALGVVLLAVLLLRHGKGLVKSGAVLWAVLSGWILSVLTGQAPAPSAGTGPLLALPGLFPWGAPTFDPGTVSSLVILGIMLIPNQIGSMKAMEQATGTVFTPERYDRGLVASGAVNVFAGLCGGVGTIPFAISAALVSVTGERSRKAFIAAALLFVGMGLLPWLGSLAGGIPRPVASAVLLVSVSSLVMIGIKSVVQNSSGQREGFIVGLGILAGVGIMMLPQGFWKGQPAWLANIAGNGAIVGTLVAMFLEHIILRQGASSE